MAQEQAFHVGVKALIRNSEGSLLLLKEGHGGTPLYDLPGGRMQSGEDFSQTLARELREEIGCTEVVSTRPFATVVARTVIPTDEGDLGLLLVVFEATIKQIASVNAVEVGTAIEWCTPERAAPLLKSKYPDAFCKQIKELA